MSCSFCGKTEQDVQVLIAGPGVSICDECVDLCQELVRKRRTPMTDEQKIIRLKEVIEWYADPKNWGHRDFSDNLYHDLWLEEEHGYALAQDVLIEIFPGELTS